MNRLLSMTLLLLLITAVNCRSKLVPAPDSKVTKEGVVSVWVGEIKDKGKKYDIELYVKNESENPIIIMLGDMSCARGGLSGMLKHTFFNTGERTIDFKGQQQKKFRMVCDLGTKTTGDFSITINKVFKDKRGDGVTAGDLLAKDIVWKYTKPE